ncbi:hypothetical protein JCM11251_002514 [Rhodosporidiobolus azoricus]
MRIYKSRYACPDLPALSIFDFLFDEGSKAASASPEMVALVDGLTGKKVTYAALRRSSLLFASGLSTVCGSFQTSTILLLSRSSIHYPNVVLAASAARLSVSLADPAATVYELVVQLKASGAGVLIVEAEHGILTKALEAARKVGLTKERVVIMPSAVSGTRLTDEELGERGFKTTKILTDAQQPFESVVLTEEEVKNDLACAFYQTLLAGEPKLTHISPYNVTSQLLQVVQMPGIFIPGETRLMAVPMAYALGLFIELYLSIHLGCTLVVYPSFLRSPFWLESKSTARRSTLVIVGPLVPLFIHDPLLEKYDLSSLRWIASGGSAIPSSAQHALTRRMNALRCTSSASSTLFPATKPFAFLQAGGMTETTCICFLPAIEEAASGKVGESVGELVAGFEARVVRYDVGKGGEGREVVSDVKDGEEGELWLRGASVSKGYLPDALATGTTVTPDGWLRTGDLVRRSPAGLFTYTGRLKPLIKNKGLQVNPVQVEHLIHSTGLVQDCAVVGVWSNKFLTELPRALGSFYPLMSLFR